MLLTELRQRHQLAGLRDAVLLGGPPAHQRRHQIHGRVFVSPVHRRLFGVLGQHHLQILAEYLHDLLLEILTEGVDEIAGGPAARVHVRTLDVATCVLLWVVFEQFLI